MWALSVARHSAAILGLVYGTAGQFSHWCY